MELKTLKDITLLYKGSEDLNEIVRHRITQEAIKWYHRSDDDKHAFIRHFFNITEDDLKESQKTAKVQEAQNT